MDTIPFAGVPEPAPIASIRRTSHARGIPGSPKLLRHSVVIHNKPRLVNPLLKGPTKFVQPAQDILNSVKWCVSLSAPHRLLQKEVGISGVQRGLISPFLPIPCIVIEGDRSCHRERTMLSDGICGCLSKTTHRKARDCTHGLAAGALRS